MSVSQSSLLRAYLHAPLWFEEKRLGALQLLFCYPLTCILFSLSQYLPQPLALQREATPEIFPLLFWLAIQNNDSETLWWFQKPRFLLLLARWELGKKRSHRSLLFNLSLIMQKESIGISQSCLKNCCMQIRKVYTIEKVFFNIPYNITYQYPYYSHCSILWNVQK